MKKFKFILIEIEGVTLILKNNILIQFLIDVTYVGVPLSVYCF